MAEQSDVESVLKDTRDRMEKSVQVFKHEADSVRTGRANPAMLESVKVEYYGSLLPLNQVATVSVPEPRLLTVQPFDKSALPQIEKDLLKADLGLTPNNDGNLIRLPVPQMTQERRQEMVKRLHKMREEAHVAVRNVRRDSLERLRGMQKAKEISEDDLKRAQERLQKVTDEFIGQADQVSSRKEAELMEV